MTKALSWRPQPRPVDPSLVLTSHKQRSQHDQGIVMAAANISIVLMTSLNNMYMYIYRV